MVKVVLHVTSLGDFIKPSIPKYFYVKSWNGIKVELKPDVPISLAIKDGFGKPFTIEIPEKFADEAILHGECEFSGLIWNPSHKNNSPLEITAEITYKLYPTKLSISMIAEIGVKKIPMTVSVAWNSRRNSFTWTIPIGSSRDTVIIWPGHPDSIWINARCPQNFGFMIHDSQNSAVIKQAFLWSPSEPIILNVIKFKP